MRVAMLAPIAWRTPPRHYGPWELVTSLLTEELVRMGVEVTLFATGDSLTAARLAAVVPVGYEEDRTVDAKVAGCLHISEVFEHAERFDIIHNQFDFLPLSYSRLVKTPVVTTIHGFSSEAIMPVYRKYNGSTHYVAISDSDRAPDLDYAATIHHGIDLASFPFHPSHADDPYLLYYGRIHPDKGTHRAIEIARRAGMRLLMAGIVQDHAYYEHEVGPFVDGTNVVYLGSVGPERRGALLGGALALLHPISFNEPFGLSVVEAMACGTPVIAFNRGSMPELIDHAETGFLVANVEEAVAALRHIGTIDRVLCRARVGERFTVERMAAAYIDVYSRILSTEHVAEAVSVREH